MEIIIYVTPTCEWSNKLKTWLKRRRIKFEERDTSESQNGEFRDELLDKTSKIVTPVLDINGEIIIGFDEDKIQSALTKAKEKKVIPP